jgi:hypothetical protein
VTTNGTHKVADAESPTRAAQEPPPLDDQSIDERLEALQQVIRTWDWRAPTVEVGPAPAEMVATAATTSTAPHQESDSPVRDPSPFEAAANTPPVFVKPTTRSFPVVPPTEADVPPTDSVAPPIAATAPATEENTSPIDTTVGLPIEADGPSSEAVSPPIGQTVPPIAATDPVTETLDPGTEELALPVLPVESAAPPLEVDQSVQGTTGEARVDGTTWFGQEPEAEPEPDGTMRRLWSHPWTKFALLAVAAAVVVVLIIAGIRIFAKNPSSAGTTASSVTQPASRPVHRSHFVAPISAAQLAQYRGYATPFQNANVVATRDFVKAGSTPTASQVVLVVVGYRDAVNIYNFQLHFVHWPQSMQSAIETDHAQLQALLSFLQAFSSVAQNGVPAWLSQLHDRSSSTQVADNVVRKDLGLPASSSFP